VIGRIGYPSGSNLISSLEFPVPGPGPVPAPVLDRTVFMYSLTVRINSLALSSYISLNDWDGRPTISAIFSCLRNIHIFIIIEHD
jgi:hypothetical protein